MIFHENNRTQPVEARCSATQTMPDSDESLLKSFAFNCDEAAFRALPDLLPAWLRPRPKPGKRTSKESSSQGSFPQ